MRLCAEDRTMSSDCPMQACWHEGTTKRKKPHPSGAPVENDPLGALPPGWGESATRIRTSHLGRCSERRRRRRPDPHL
ncbi:hypothetical protein EYF80_058850 [Liparis tanakae]|uniref:Uncharacterized protein n=1 Tax=Liparis tanakae TaxID=230148 RepID=A0A4Z2EQD2_9TELE|nr:hypothetical protein EYF80_058850 [Liparis tanakae]